MNMSFDCRAQNELLAGLNSSSARCVNKNLMVTLFKDFFKKFLQKWKKKFPRKPKHFYQIYFYQIYSIGQILKTAARELFYYNFFIPLKPTNKHFNVIH